MNKSPQFILMILIYLALSKGLEIHNRPQDYLFSVNDILRTAPSAPFEVILTDTEVTGTFIKTYYLKYDIVRPFKKILSHQREASAEFYHAIKEYRGMSILRKKSRLQPVQTTPSIPGASFIGDPAYGRWDKAQMRFLWTFYPIYSKLPQDLGIENFEISLLFYQQWKDKLAKNEPFFGDKKLFGEHGEITRTYYPQKILTEFNFSDFVRFHLKPNHYRPKNE